MSNKKTLEQMSTTEAKRAGITSLADRPNDASRYGDGGLSATMLKERFDALPNLVREKFNKIAEVLAGADAARYITLGGEDNALGETLFDFLALFGPRGDGITDKNISDLIETLYQGEGDEGASSRTLKDIVASICARLVDLRNFAGRAVGDFSLWVDEEGRMIVDAIDLTGDAFKLNAIDPIGKAGIRDGAVGFEKLDSELGERVSRAFAKARYTASDGKLHFDSEDGVELDSIDLPLESIIVSGTFDTSTKDLVFTLVGGGTLRIPFDEYIEAVASDVSRLNAKTDKSFKTAALAGDSTLVFETHDGSTSTVDLSTVALDGQTRDAIARLEKNDVDHERRISNLEEHISDDYFVTDDSVAYSKAVPARACSSAKLMSLGGMTYKCNNIFNPSNITGLRNLTNNDGVYKQVQADTYEVLYFRVQKWKGANFIDFAVSVFAVHGGLIKCSFVKDDTFDIISIGLNGQDIDTVIKYDVSNLPNGTYYLSLNMTNATQGSITFEEIMLSTKDVPYEPYYEGLRDSKVTEIKSYGANKLPYPYTDTTKTQAGVTYTDNGDGTITVNGTTTDITTFRLSISMPLKNGQTYSFKDMGAGVPLVLSYKDETGATKYVSSSVVWSSSYTFVQLYIQVRNTTVNNAIVKPMFNVGSVVAEYKPYRAEPIVVYPIPAEIQAIEGYGKDGFNIDLLAQTSDYNGSTKPLPVFFDSIIKVEGGGSLEFVNEYKNPVPSAVKYLLKEESAV